MKNSKIDIEMKSTLFMVNIVLNTKIKRLQEELEDLKETLKRLKAQKSMKGMQMPFKHKTETPKPKRKRKKKSEVERNYSCNIDNCQKSYGSENSLNQHMKIKHPEFWMRIKEQEQNLTAINNYSIQDPRFNNPRALLSELAMSKTKLKPFPGAGPRDQVRMERSLTGTLMSRVVEEVSDSDDHHRGRTPVENLEG